MLKIVINSDEIGRTVSELEDIITIYTFEKKQEDTLITMDLDFKADGFLAKIFKSMIRKMLLNKGIRD